MPLALAEDAEDGRLEELRPQETQTKAKENTSGNSACPRSLFTVNPLLPHKVGAPLYAHWPGRSMRFTDGSALKFGHRLLPRLIQKEVPVE